MTDITHMTYNQVLYNDLIIVCLSFLPIKKIIQIREITKKWKLMIETHRWDFQNQSLIIYYRSIFEKRMNWFLWLNKNNIDPNFTRTNNMIAFSLCYSSPQIVEWFIEKEYPLSKNNEMLELKAIKKGRNPTKMLLLEEYLKKLIKGGRTEYIIWLNRMKEPQFLFESNDYEFF
jgi:hypothetical protein